MAESERNRSVCKSLDAERSRYALDEVKRWTDSQSEDATTLAKGLPVAVRTQGLVVTLARLLSADRGHHRLLARCLSDWLSRDCPVRLVQQPQSPGQLLERLIRMEPMDYLAVQREALALAERLKLLADALYGGTD